MFSFLMNASAHVQAHPGTRSGCLEYRPVPVGILLGQPRPGRQDRETGAASIHLFMRSFLSLVNGQSSASSCLIAGRC